MTHFKKRGVRETEDECIQSGGKWVESYRKWDGTLVHGFCRDRNSKNTMDKPFVGRWSNRRIAVDQDDNGNYNFSVWATFDDPQPYEGSASTYAEALKKAKNVATKMSRNHKIEPEDL